MKAVEFIKQYGWERTLKAMPKISRLKGERNIKLINDLKLLVESHELVDKVGGLDNAKSLINHFKFVEHGHLIPDGLEKAIADVESCQ